MSADDLRKLATLIEDIAKDAADREVLGHTKPDGQSEEDFQIFLTNLRAALTVRASVRSTSGEWLSGKPADVLKDEALPDTIEHVMLDSAFDFKAQMRGQTPANYVTVNLGFRRRAVFDTSQDAVFEEAKQSNAVLFSSDPTWVAGAQRKLEAFFNERRTHRRWLHGPRTYDVLVILLGFPLALLWANRVDGWITSRLTLSAASRVAILVYVVLVLLFLFRVIYNYAARTFPRYEGPRRGSRSGQGAILFLLLQIVVWFSTLFLDAIKRLFFP